MPKKSEQAKSNARRRAAKKAGAEAGAEAVGSMVDRWAVDYDDAAGLPARKLGRDTLPARLDRLKRETGKTAPAKIVALGEEIRVLTTETAGIAGKAITDGEALITRLEKQEALDDAATVREAAKANIPADLGDSPLARAKDDLLEHRRYAAAVRVLQQQVNAEIVVVSAQAPFENFLRRVWNEFVVFEIVDTMSIGDAKATEARAAEVSEILWSLYRTAKYTTHSALMKPLRAAWDDAFTEGAAMPTVASIEEKLHAPKLAAEKQAEVDEKAAAERKALAAQDAAAGARARNPQKVDRDAVSS